MKRNILIAVLLTALTAATVSCLRDEPMPVPDPTTTVSYLVDGQEYILMMSGPNSFDNLLDSLFNLAEQGSTVILNNRMYATGNGSSPDPEIYVTPNRDSAYAWCKERYEAGLTVYISYDETTRNYNCIAMATYHPDQHLLYVSIDRGESQMLFFDSPGFRRHLRTLFCFYTPGEYPKDQHGRSRDHKLFSESHFHSQLLPLQLIL